MKPLAPIPNAARLVLGILFFVLFFAAWALATLGGFVSKTFLADPITMVEEGWLLLTQHGFLADIGVTIWRVVGGFVLAAVVAVPLGILMALTSRSKLSLNRLSRLPAICRHPHSFRS